MSGSQQPKKKACDFIYLLPSRQCSITRSVNSIRARLRWPSDFQLFIIFQPPFIWSVVKVGHQLLTVYLTDGSK